MFTIKAVHEVDWYSLFYLISSVLTFTILFFLGWKKGYPLLSWVLILVSGALSFIIGTKLLSFRAEEWTILFREGVFPYTDNKSAIGGLLFAIMGIELTRSWLKIREFVLDTYVLMVPLGLAIQKIGCLMAGCCFGTPTSLAWGVQYAQGTVAHYHHWILNSVTATDAFSLPVHPVPIYEALSYLFIFGALILLAPYLKKRGSRFLLALTLLALSRFTLEFFRDPAATIALGQMIGGIKAMQWVMLVMGLASGFLLLRKLRKPFTSLAKPEESSDYMWRKFTMILLLSFLMWAVHEGFSPTEMLVMNFKLLPALVLFGIHSWIRFTVPRFRLAGIIILILPLLIMGQTVPGTKPTWKEFHSFGVGGTFGSLSQDAHYNEHEGACGTVYDHKYYKQNYGMATLNYNYSRQKGYIRYIYGGSIFGGVNREEEINIPGFTRHYSFGIHPYMDINSRWVGAGLGLSIGYLNYAPSAPFEERTIYSGIRTFPVLPYIRFRVGPYDIIDLEYKFLDEFPTQLPVPTHHISMGSGLGMINGSGLRLGFAVTESAYDPGYFISANVLIKERYMIQAKYMIQPNNYSVYSDRFSNLFSFGLSYRLPAQPRTSNVPQGN